MAEQRHTWAAWIADADGYFRSELDANGVSETFDEFAKRVADRGDTATEKGTDPKATRPPDRMREHHVSVLTQCAEEAHLRGMPEP